MSFLAQEFDRELENSARHSVGSSGITSLLVCNDASPNRDGHLYQSLATKPIWSRAEGLTR